MRTLLILTANFPFEKQGDSNFIKNEIEELCNHFDQVKLLSTASNNEGGVLFEHQIAERKRVSIKKFRIIKALKAAALCLSKQARDEIRYARQNYTDVKVLKIISNIFKYYYTYNCLLSDICKMSDETTYIYSYWLSSRAFAAAKAVASKKCKAKAIVSRAHGFDVYKDRGYQPFRSYLLKTLDRIYFVSRDGKEDFERKIAASVSGNIKCRLGIYRLGVLVSSDSNPGAEDRNNPFRIVSCSNVIPIKRLDLMIKAAALLDFDVEWTHYGDGPEMQHIKMLAEDILSKNKFVKFIFAGKIGNSELMGKYKTEHIDLFVNTSDNEGVPVSIMEAQQFGIPAIARNVGGNSEIIIEELLLPADTTPEIIASLIKEYAQNQQAHIEGIRNKCREKVQLEYNAVENTRAFCTQLLAREEQHAER